MTGSVQAAFAALKFLTRTLSNAVISRRATQQMTAGGTLTNNTIQDLTSFATWSSSPQIAVVSSSGLAIPVAPGSAVITAGFDGLFDLAVVTVID